MILYSRMKYFKFTGIADAIAASVFRETPLHDIFPELTTHMMEMSVGDNHVYNLIKTVSKNYSKIKLYHLGRVLTDRLTGERVRKKFTKLVLFKNQ